MDEGTASAIAETARGEHQIPPGYVRRSAGRRIIELADGDGPDVRVRDVSTWVVRFQNGIAWADLAVDEVTAQVVRVQRSRAR